MKTFYPKDLFKSQLSIKLVTWLLTENFYRNRPNRNKRGEFPQTTFIPITYQPADTSIGVETNQLFTDSDKIYRINITYTGVIFGGLEPAIKYLVRLKAVNRDTDSLSVLLDQFTSQL